MSCAIIRDMKARFLEVWCSGSLYGTIRERFTSVAAKAIIKRLGPGAELRDPVCYEIYRYDPETDCLITFD